MKTDDMLEEVMLDELLGVDDGFGVDPAELERERLLFIHNPKRRNQYQSYLDSVITDCEQELWRHNPDKTPHFDDLMRSLVKYAAHAIIFDCGEESIQTAAAMWRSATFSRLLLNVGIAVREKDEATGRIVLDVPPKKVWDDLLQHQDKPGIDWNFVEKDIDEEWDRLLEKWLNIIHNDIESTLVKKLRDAEFRKAQKAKKEAARIAQEQKAQQEASRAAIGWGEF